MIRESVSFEWILERIKKTFKLSTKGESFLDGLDIKFEFDESFTYQQAWMMLKNKYVSSLLQKDDICMGEKRDNKEVLSPLAMNFLVREWLQKIDPRLPNHVRHSRGHLFTTQRPTLACNQEILCDQIDTMLQELDSKETSANSQVNVNYIPQGRGFRGGRGGGFRGGFRSRPSPGNWRPFNARSRGRSPFPPTRAV